MAELINTIKDVSKNYRIYDKWEQTRANKMAQKEFLLKGGFVPNNLIEETKKRALPVIRATEIMDTRSENNCENVEQIVGIVAGIPSMGIAMAQTPINKAIENHLNKKINKSLEITKQELINTKDETVRNSLVEKIKNYNKTIQNNFKKANKIGFYGSMGLIFLTAVGMILWGNSQQKEASRIGRFQAKQDELKDLDNFIAYTPEQIEEAKIIAQNIPDKKEKNSFSQTIQELKEMQSARKSYKNWVKQKDPNELDKLKNRELSPEKIKEAKKDQELITNTVAEINVNAEEFSENLENTFDTFGTLSWLIAAPLGFGINKLLSLAKTSKNVRLLISLLVPTMTAIGIQLTGTMEQKEAAKIGRFYARKDLTENPYKLVAFSEEEFAQAKNVKAPKQKRNFFKKIGDSFKFLKNYYKYKKEFKIYKETGQKFNEKMQMAFKQIETTEEQKAEAKTLQTNVFRAFDEVDEMSQRYSEDIEASTEIAKAVTNNIFQLGWFTGIALLTAGILKGKLSLIKPTQWLNNLTFSPNSSIKKAIDKLLKTLSKQDKSFRANFQKAVLRGSEDVKSLLENSKNTEVKTALEELKNEISKITQKGNEELLLKKQSRTSNEIYEELLNNHIKQTKSAKWLRNILVEIAKLKTKSKARSMGIDIPVEKQEELKLNGIKNYKTLIYTSLIAGVPILAPLFAVPYIFNAWLTDIQKKAGKIGVMRAMNRLEDPKIFAP